MKLLKLHKPNDPKQALREPCIKPGLSRSLHTQVRRAGEQGPAHRERKRRRLRPDNLHPPRRPAPGNAHTGPARQPTDAPSSRSRAPTPAVHLSGTHTHTRVRPDNLHLHRRAAADEHPRPATHPAPPLMRSCRRGKEVEKSFLNAVTIGFSQTRPIMLELLSVDRVAIGVSHHTLS